MASLVERERERGGGGGLQNSELGSQCSVTTRSAELELELLQGQEPGATEPPDPSTPADHPRATQSVRPLRLLNQPLGGGAGCT
jgi:hypothetical protein